MTDYKISALTEKTTPAGTDYVVIVDSEDTTTPPAGAAGSNKKVKISNLPSGSGSSVLDWFSVKAYGASTSASAATNTTAFQSAWAAAKAAGGGRIYVPAGSYDLNCSGSGIGGDVAGTQIFWQGDGRYNTFLNGHGSGVLFKVADSTLWSSKTVNGGGIIDLTLDGSGTTGTTDGFLLDSINLFEFKVNIRNFVATTSSNGFHMNNTFSWSENLRGAIGSNNNANGYVFESPSQGTGNATGSFERSILELNVQQHGNGNGLVLRNNADGLGSRIILLGNFQTGNAAFSSISIDSTSDLTGSLFVELENDGPPSGTSGWTTLPATISGTGFLAGQIEASWSSNPDGWTVSTLATNDLTGTVSGDTNLQTITAANLNYYLTHNGTFAP